MTQRSTSNQSVLSLALASRGLAPTRIVHDAAAFESRRGAVESAQAWFVGVMVAVFAVVSLGQSLPIG
jgi:hypothetical protein